MSLELAASKEELLGRKEELTKRFYSLRTPRDVARLLDVDYSQLVYHIYKTPPSKRYTTFRIRKKSGGFRRILAPVTPLKIIQRKLNQVLQCVYQPKAPAQGFIFDKSIVTNAHLHTKRKYVLNVDLLDFFPSINRGRVQGMFKAIPYGLDPSVARVLARICCFNNQLPQGAPTSPIVSNMICAKMDSELRILANRNRCVYSRYADDITFSTSVPTFPKALATINSAGQLVVGTELNRVVNENGFKINLNKVRLQTKFRRQEVTGLTVNEKPNVSRKYVRYIRSLLYAWETFGPVDAAQVFWSNQANEKHRGPFKSKPSFEQVVKGKIEFLGMVRGKDDNIYLRFRDRLKKLAPHLVKDKNPAAHLLEKYDKLTNLRNANRRGYLLQDLLNETFRFYSIWVKKSFTRNEGAEQIDGAFILDNWHYIVECRWRKKLADIRELDGLYGQVGRSGKHTMGFFLSINGWSRKVPSLLRQNPEKCVILMNGDDFRQSLTPEVDFKEFIRKKVERLSFNAEPYYSVSEYLKDHKNF